MSLIKQHLHKLENPTFHMDQAFDKAMDDYYPIDIDDRYQVELSLSLGDVELILSYLEETDDPIDNALADEIRTQTYA